MWDSLPNDALCMQNLLTHLNQDWINYGLIRKYFTIIVSKFKELVPSSWKSKCNLLEIVSKFCIVDL